MKNKMLWYLALIPVIALLIFNVVIPSTCSRETDAVVNDSTADAAKDDSLVVREETLRDELLQTEDQGNVNPNEKKTLIWKLTLVNGDNPLPDEFVPVLSEVCEGYMFDSRAVEPLEAMMEAGDKAGLKLRICSAYRTYEVQAKLYEGEVAKQRAKGLSEADAIVEGKRTVAYPGESEHNLGLAVDIFSEDYPYLEEGFADTLEAIWLKEHCAEYGFILRYPKDKTDITGIIFEPWHFRYVGVEAATYMMEKGLTLEEYLELVD